MYFDQRLKTCVPIGHDIHYYNYMKCNAQNIQVGIINHAHLIRSDQENSIYQLFDDCIIGEAHRLPDYAPNQVTSELDYSDTEHQLDLIRKSENEKLLKLVNRLEQQRILERLDIPPVGAFGLKSSISGSHELNGTLSNHIFNIAQHSDVHGDDVHRYHYVFDFDSTHILKDLHTIVDKINKTLEFFNGTNHKTIKSIRKQLLCVNDNYRHIEQSLKQNHTAFISIKNLNQKSTTRLIVKGYGVQDILTKQVLEKFKPLTFISGTPTFNHSFEASKNWFKEGVEFSTYEVQSSPQNHKSTNIYISSDVVSYDSKSTEDYMAPIVDYIQEYVTITQSKCLVLFINYRMMHMVQELLNELPTFNDYVVLTQQQNQNYKIVQQFNHFDKTILLGTSTFFGGFGYQSNGIKCVMTAKLSFINKYNAKHWLMDSEFESTFKDYVLPDAVTRFRQDPGRLIHNEGDKGLIVPFDNRLTNNNYKRFSGQSLESYSQEKGDIQQFNELLYRMQTSKLRNRKNSLF